jgi:hypothetical protein
MADDIVLQRNKLDRERAEECIALLEEESRGSQRFWECIRDMAQAKLPRAAEPRAEEGMTELEARRFERHMMPRGEHAGREVGVVPTEYLCWWAEGDDFTKALRKYIKTPTFRLRQRDEN